MSKGFTSIKNINYGLVDELIEATEGLNYSRVKELLNDSECDVNCPRLAAFRSHAEYMFKTPLKAANDTGVLEMFKIYIECDRIDVLTWFSVPDSMDYVGWKQYYKCHCRQCKHTHAPFYLHSEFERLTYGRIKRDLMKRDGNLELLPFYVTDFNSAPFFRDSLQYMADINAKNSYGYTLLNWVVKKKNDNIKAQMKALLERNPDADVEFPDGTPVMVTLCYSFSCNRSLFIRLARSMIIHGADIFATDSNGNNFIDLNIELEKILPFNSPLFPVIMKSYLLSPKSKNFSNLVKIIETSAEARRIWLELVPTIVEERFLSREANFAYRLEPLFKELLKREQDLDDEAKLKFFKILINQFSGYKLEDIVEKLNISEEFFIVQKEVLLHECITANRISFVDMFLNVYKADPNYIVDGLHPLFRCKDLAICTELITAGADPLYDDGKGKFFNRIRLKRVYESAFESLMKVLDTNAIPFDEPNPETGKTFAYILAEADFLCPIENVNLNLVINNVPLYANLDKLDQFFKLTQGREIDYLAPDSEGNTILHRLGQFKKHDSFYNAVLLSPMMSSYFFNEKNNKGETPFDVIASKADEEEESFSILRTLISIFIECKMIEKLKIFMNRLKHKCQENGLLFFDRLCEDGFMTAIDFASLEICEFWIEEFNVDLNKIDFTDEFFDDIGEYAATYLFQKRFKDKFKLLYRAFECDWDDFLDNFVKEMGPYDLYQLKMVLDGWEWVIPKSLLTFVSRPDLKSHLETSQLSNLLFSYGITVREAQILVDVGADPLYFARTRSCFVNWTCDGIYSEVWYFMKQKGLTFDHFQQMRVSNNQPFLKLLYIDHPNTFEKLLEIFAPIQFGIPCKFQDLKNYQVIGDTGMCSICHDEFSADDDLTILECKHFFHTACANPSMRSRPACPYCRAPSLI